MARTGRPRGFDRDAAIEQAMLVFWQHGYEAASLAQLKAAMGDIATASFYAAFGSKEELFRTVLARYLETHGRVMNILRDRSLRPRDALEGALRQSAVMQTAAGHPPGCLVVLATTVASPENAHLQALLAAERDGNRAAIRVLIDDAIKVGELRRETPAPALAAMYDSFLVGLTVQARDGVKFKTLDAAVTEIMRVWDGYAAEVEASVVPTSTAFSKD